MSRRIEVEFVTKSCALIRGYGSRELVMERTRRGPVWATSDRAWVVQPHKARDIIALAESRGYAVTVTEPQEDRQDPAEGRW